MLNKYLDGVQPHELVHDIDECPRCFQNHGAVAFSSFDWPLPFSDKLGITFDYWYICPNDKGPVMLTNQKERIMW